MVGDCAVGGSTNPEYLDAPRPSYFRFMPTWDDYYGFSTIIQGNEIMARAGLGNKFKDASDNETDSHHSWPENLELNTSQLANVIIGPDLDMIDTHLYYLNGSQPLAPFTTDICKNVMPPFDSGTLSWGGSYTVSYTHLTLPTNREV